MVEPRPLARALLLLLPLAATGCATSSRPPVEAKSEAEKSARAAQREQPPAPAEPAPVPASPPAVKPSPEETPAKSTAVDVVDPGGESAPANLVEAAKANKERRAHSGKPVTVITDKTLPHLPKGQLTYAEPKKKTPAGKADGKAADAAKEEEYWRGRALEIRTRWKKTADELKELEQSAAGWRRRFYAENDPYARDAQIKPEWDRVLDRLGKARAEIEATRKELDDFLEEGRRAGALPGWLREGAELEPAQEKKSKEPGTLEPKEPPVVPEKQENHG
jgi:hypothetical protein